ncbi:MAG: ABC transporter ATP-binding protein [Micropepsaceae bacterium]
MLLSLDNVTKTFPNGTLALDRVSLAVAPGEFVSLVGPSGCGKSTVLRLIAGLIEPSAGKVLWTGAKPSVGFVFQDAALMPWTSVANNIRLPLDLTRADEAVAERRVADALELVGLAKFANAYPRELSGGMRMRVSIARALAMDASVLLMDEPFAALDELTRDRLNDELREIWAAKNLTIVFVTHSVYESVYLSSRVIVMSPRPGRIVADIAMAEPKVRDRDFRTTPAYGDRCRQVREALQREMAPS